MGEVLDVSALRAQALSVMENWGPEYTVAVTSEALRDLIAQRDALLGAVGRFIDVGAHPDTYAALRAARAKATEG